MKVKKLSKVLQTLEYMRCVDFEDEVVEDIVNAISVLSVVNCQTENSLQSSTRKTEKS